MPFTIESFGNVKVNVQPLVIIPVRGKPDVGEEGKSTVERGIQGSQDSHQNYLLC